MDNDQNKPFMVFPLNGSGDAMRFDPRGWDFIGKIDTERGPIIEGYATFYGEDQLYRGKDGDKVKWIIIMVEDRGVPCFNLISPQEATEWLLRTDIPAPSELAELVYAKTLLPETAEQIHREAKHAVKSDNKQDGDETEDGEALFQIFFGAQGKEQKQEPEVPISAEKKSTTTDISTPTGTKSEKEKVQLDRETANTIAKLFLKKDKHTSARKIAKKIYRSAAYVCGLEAWIENQNRLKEYKTPGVVPLTDKVAAGIGRQDETLKALMENDKAAYDPSPLSEIGQKPIFRPSV